MTSVKTFKSIFTFSFALRILGARVRTDFANGWSNTDDTRPSLNLDRMFSLNQGGIGCSLRNHLVENVLNTLRRF